MGKEQLCIINWEDEIRLPGPDFDAKKLGARDHHRIAGSYINTKLDGGEDHQAFSVEHRVNYYKPPLNLVKGEEEYNVN